MNKQDYEQKKREYWEEFLQKHEISRADGVTADAFIMAFDRAYTLGKLQASCKQVKEAITQEEIEKAAKKYAAEVDKNVRDLYGIEEQPASLTFGECAAESFREGAKFALGKQEKDAEGIVISGWVFVDDTTFDRILCVRKVTQGEYEVVWDSGHPEFCLGKELFPDMGPNKLPEPVEIIIKKKKNG